MGETGEGAATEGLRLWLAEVSVPPVLVVAGQDATEAPDTTATAFDAQRPAPRLWRRLRRALGRS